MSESLPWQGIPLLILVKHRETGSRNFRETGRETAAGNHREFVSHPQISSSRPLLLSTSAPSVPSVDDAVPRDNDTRVDNRTTMRRTRLVLHTSTRSTPEKERKNLNFSICRRNRKSFSVGDKNISSFFALLIKRLFAGEKEDSREKWIHARGRPSFI